jgi:hypothetical protein
MNNDVTQKKIFHRWSPLAASWLLMAIELPMVSAFVARMENPEINLAAYGGLIFPLALLIESPIIMLLAASTALCKDWKSYVKVRRFMLVTGGLLTVLHILVAFTPLYYVVVRTIIGIPEPVLEPARIGLMIMTPWTMAIAYRRFQQGVLIRFNRSGVVGKGTMIRLVTLTSFLVLGFFFTAQPGIIIGSFAVAMAVTSEAIFVGISVQSTHRGPLRKAITLSPALTWKGFTKFYTPLALTSFMSLLILPLGSAALSRMPMAIESLAVWPVVSGLLFLLRSSGIAYQEVVVAMLDEPEGYPKLKRFTWGLSGGLTAVLLLVAATPLALLWFQDISGLTADLIPLARTSLWIGVLFPALTVFVHWYQGILMNRHRTRGVTEATGILMGVVSIVLFFGVAWGEVSGLILWLVAIGIGATVQIFWLIYCCHRTRTLGDTPNPILPDPLEIGSTTGE